MAAARPATHRLLAAIGVSLAVHLIVLAAPAWRLPVDEVGVLPPLDARLAPLPPPALRPPDPKRPILGDAPSPQPRVPPPLPLPPGEPPAGDASAEPGGLKAETSLGAAANDARPPAPEKAHPAAGEGPAPPVAAPAAAPPAAAASKTAAPGLAELWAASGRIQYNVIRGESNFVIGRTTHAWTHDETRYSMETVIETSGLIGLVKPFRMVQRSEGHFGPKGLMPDKFTVERDGKVKERADFDWSSAQVVLLAGERRREFSLAEGDQDVLSLMHHLALQPEGPLRAELLVVTGKSAVRSVIENLGIEEIVVPAGRVSAYHLGSSGHHGELKIDIWLARDYANLPVRLKITDKNGDVLDQVATGVDLGRHSAK